MVWVEPSAERYQAFCKIADDINVKLARIQQDTGLYSSHTAMLTHPDFLNLVEMGDKIVPYLFHVMMEHGCSWVHIFLLRKITNVDPIKNTSIGKFYHIIHDWLEWYLESKYADSDVYYGLVE